jgi:hypothetical protein
MSWAEEGGSLGGGVTDENAARGSLGAASPAVPIAGCSKAPAPPVAQSVAGGNVAAQNPAMSMRRMKLTFFCCSA